MQPKVCIEGVILYNKIPKNAPDPGAFILELYY